MESFSLENYDGIGFDLDCTLAEYNVKELMKLVYDLLVKFLIEQKSYPNECLLQPYEEGQFFLIKGLIMDLKKGNILKIGENGLILRASHGTALLTEEKIVEQYGPEKMYNINDFVNDPLSMLKSSKETVQWNLDIFDTPCVLIFARLVDYLDKKSDEKLTEYNIWPDILKGLHYIYSKEDFTKGQGGFFSALKENPSKYYTKWSDEKIAWLAELKKKKFVYLLTGSFIDFATLTASVCIGENWKDYFDVVLCYAQKPFFFTSEFSFVHVKDLKEIGIVEDGDLHKNSIYSRGNWKDLKKLISTHTDIQEPKCLYVGDNLVQDVYSPAKYKCCDTVAVSVELNNEFGISKFWGSYFEENGKLSFCNYLIQNNARICISGLDVFSKRPLNFQYFCLKKTEESNLKELNGYYSV